MPSKRAGELTLCNRPATQYHTKNSNLNFESMENKIQMVISPETVNAAHQKMAELDALLPGLISLTPDEKRGGMKIGEKSLSFVSKGIEFMQHSPEFKPGYVDAPEAKRDFEAANNLFAIGRQLQVLVDKINDTATQAGMEAMSAVMAYYNNVKQGSRQGVAGAKTVYDDLSVRFPGRATLPPTQPTV